MRDQLQWARGNASNIASFIASGSHHCVTQESNFYAVEAAGVHLYDWVDDLVSGRAMTVAVDCFPNC